MIFRMDTKKIYSSLILTLLAFLFYLPVFSNAQSSAPNTGITYECVNGTIYGNCTFADLIAAIKKITDYGAKFALMFSVVVIAYAGFRYMISGDNQGERTKANKMLLSVAWGVGYILAAWLIVTLILSGLGVKGIANDIFNK